MNEGGKEKQKEKEEGEQLSEASLRNVFFFLNVKQNFVVSGFSLSFRVPTAPFSVWCPHTSSKKGMKGELCIFWGKGGALL